MEKDFLTNSYTRDAMEAFLTTLDAENASTGRPYALLILDIDHFKHFNDRQGHLAGDEALKFFAGAVHWDFEGEEYRLFRFGGDEFVVVFPGKTASEAHTLAGRLSSNIKKRLFILKGKRLRMSFSGGVAAYPDHGGNYKEVIEHADKALYVSKKKGRGRTTNYQKIKGGLGLLFSRIFWVAFVAGVCGLAVWSLQGSGPGAKLLESPFWKKQVQHLTPDAVYMKPAGILRGKVIHENDNEVWMNVDMGRGEGLVVVKRGAIERIEKATGSVTESATKTP